MRRSALRFCLLSQVNEEEITDNSNCLDSQSKCQDQDKKEFVRNVEKVIDQIMAFHKTTRSVVLIPTAQEADKERDFLLARRTILLWPVDLASVAGNAVRGFMEMILEMPNATTKSVNIEKVDKVEQTRRSKIKMNHESSLHP